MHPDRPSPTITTKCHSISNEAVAILDREDLPTGREHAKAETRAQEIMDLIPLHLGFECLDCLDAEYFAHVPFLLTAPQ